MPYKNIFNIKFIDNVSMSTSITSEPLDLSTVQGLSFHAFWDGAPTGSFHLEVSNDSGEHWAIFQDASIDIPVPDNTVFWNISDVHFDFIRLVYTATSGSGNLTVWVNGKGDDAA